MISFIKFVVTKQHIIEVQKVSSTYIQINNICMIASEIIEIAQMVTNNSSMAPSNIEMFFLTQLLVLFQI